MKMIEIALQSDVLDLLRERTLKQKYDRAQAIGVATNVEARAASILENKSYL